MGSPTMFSETVRRAATLRKGVRERAGEKRGVVASWATMPWVES